MTQRAEHIYQDWLDRVSALIMANDFEAVAANMHYPQTMATEDGVLAFENPAEMVEAAAAFRAFLARMGTTDYHRICESAVFEGGGDRISGEHTTYIVRGGSFAVPPYRNTMWLRFDGDRWLGAGIEAAVPNRTCTVLSPDMLRRAREERP